MKYLLTLFGVEGEQQDQLSPEELTQMIQPWNEYGRELEGAGAFVAGDALQPSRTATTVEHQPGGERLVTDGPFAETKEQLGGFYLIECENLDQALEWAKKVPVGEGSTVEVRPVMDFSEFGYEEPRRAEVSS